MTHTARQGGDWPRPRRSTGAPDGRNGHGSRWTRGKAKEFLDSEKGEELSDKGLDAAGDAAGRATGGKFDGQIDGAQKAADQRIGDE